MNKARYFLIPLLLIVFACSQFLYADVYMKQKKHTGAMNIMGQNQPAKDSIEEIWITDRGSRSDDPENTVMVMLNEKKMIMLDHKEKTYMEFPMDWDTMSESMMQDEDEESMKAMQGMMQNMMKFEATVESTGEKQKINNWNCTKYIFTLNTFMGPMTQEIWATEDIKIDQNMYQKYAGSFLSAMPGMQNSMGQVMKELEKIKGVHVKSTMEQKIMNQTVTSSTELLEYSEKSAPKDLFDVPKGYKKKSMHQ